MMPALSLPDPEAWLTVAKTQLGIKEVPGPDSNPEIQKYFRSTTLGGRPEDDVPWCSAFVNWVLEQACYRGTRKANARSWLKWGLAVEPRVGAIVVLWRVSPDGRQGHVGFCTEVLPGKVVLLGGNQNDKVCRQEYAFGRVLGSRWPLATDRMESSGGSAPADPGDRSPDTCGVHRPSTRRST